MNRDAWVARHPYLQPIADVRAAVEAAASQVSSPAAWEPDWQGYAADYFAGVPLLHSEHGVIDVPDAPSLVNRMLSALAERSGPAWLHEQCRSLEHGLQDEGAMAQPLSRLLLWAALARDLAPVLSAFDRWRDEERWLRNYCPACGAAPAMAQLVGMTEGRLRLLSCGCCGTRWRYRRTGCPFCEPVDDHRLAVVAVEDEDGLRIDYCDRCQGYIKTYDGQGSEAVLLADWTSLHLDLLARERGLKRLASSLYEV
jgi:FdhE protein